PKQPFRLLKGHPAMIPSSGFPLQVKNPKEQGNRCLGPQETTYKFECPDKGNHVGMNLGGSQVQVIKHSHLEVVERKTESEIFKYDLVHREGVLSKFRANACVPCRPHDLKISLKPLLASAVLDDNISLPVGIAINRSYPSGFRTDPVQSRVVNSVDQINAFLGVNVLRGLGNISHLPAKYMKPVNSTANPLFRDTDGEK
ncbi:unnamed protein product, partial [Vicia faba]